MVTHGLFFLSITSLLTWAAAAADKKGGKEKKGGFLAVDRDRDRDRDRDDEVRLWNAFADSERQLRRHDVEKQRETSSAHRKQPQEETERPTVPDWDPGLGLNVWLADPPEPGSKDPVIVNYSLPVMLGTPPCEDRIQDCTSMTQTCIEIKELIANRIIEAEKQIHLTANENPMLSTLAINSSAHRKHSVVPSHQLAPSSALAPDIFTDLQSFIPPVPGVHEAAIAGPPLQVHGRPPIRPTSKSSWQLGEKAIATPPRPFVPDITDAAVSRREVIGRVSDSIANELLPHIQKEVAHHVNTTCSDDEEVMLDDCKSYRFACMDSVKHQRGTLRELNRQLRQAQEQMRREEENY